MRTVEISEPYEGAQMGAIEAIGLGAQLTSEIRAAHNIMESVTAGKPHSPAYAGIVHVEKHLRGALDLIERLKGKA